MLNIAIVEDDHFFRSELESTINFQPTWKCIISSPSAEHFKENFPKRMRIDFAFVDIHLPGKSGIDLIPFILSNSPNAEIIILTRSEERNDLLQSFHHGATGYLNKGFSLLQLPQFIKTVTDGGALISPSMAKYLVQYFNPTGIGISDSSVLSLKEKQVLDRLAEGNTYQEVADIIGLTKDGVRSHVKNIYSKLNVNKRADAIRAWKNISDE